MSTYVTMEHLQYANREAFDNMCEMLRVGGWMDDEGYFIDEMRHRVSEQPNADAETLSIEIPPQHWRNLGVVNFFSPVGTTGKIVGTCTDGCFQGWVKENGKKTTYDLEKWAAENLDDGDEKPPKREEYEDQDDYFQNLVDWQQTVEFEFITEFN